VLVHVDRAREQVLAAGVEHVVGAARVDVGLERREAPVLDGDVEALRSIMTGSDDLDVGDQQIKFRHE
jgi:hypothetical protein